MGNAAYTPPNQTMGDAFDLSMFQGPYAAPLTNLQMDSMEGFGQFMKANPIVHANDIRTTLDRTVGAGVPYSNLSSFNNAISGVQNKTNAASVGAGGTGAYNYALPSFQAALTPKGFDATAMFNAGDKVFADELARLMANTKEEFSSLGLGPGSTDRENRLLRTAGTETAKYQLGKQDIARQAFEDQQNRGLQALSLAPSLVQAGEAGANRTLDAARTEAAILPQIAAAAQVPFQENLQDRALATNTLPILSDLYKMPADLATTGYAMGAQGQATADAGIQRMLAEFGRTQGGQLQQILAIMNGMPQQDIGPSPMSQWAQIIQGLATAYGAYQAGKPPKTDLGGK